jgi:hypothetical protein
MSSTPRDIASRPPIVVDGRILAPSVYRPSTFVEFEDTPAWWSSLSALGALLLLAGVLVGARVGDAVAVGGVGLFFATAVVAGAERTELATALGASGVIWTAAGISVVLGTDPSTFGSFLGIGLCGVALLIAGIVGRARTGGIATDPGGDGPT